MKSFLIILITVNFLSCNNQTNKNNNSLIGFKFQNYKQIKQLQDYIKISDTVIYENNINPKFGLSHLRNNTQNLVIFSDISIDSNYNRTFDILDTLIIPNSSKSEVVTIGYCQRNEDNDENLIAVVEKSENLNVESIKKIWSANTISKKMENVTNINGIICINEWFVEK